MELNKYIDHTNLKPTATKNDITKLCEEAMEYGFASVCVHPYYVKYAKNILKKSNVAISTVIGFPLGSNTTETKAFEAHEALKNGADELDIVINIAALKNKDYAYIENEIVKLLEVTSGHIIKIIIESSLLNNEEIIKMCEICNNNFVHFIKTSTGFSDGGATIDVVKLIRENINDMIEIKASGGIKDYNTALSMIDAGATRIGTSNGIKIMEGLK